MPGRFWITFTASPEAPATRRISPAAMATCETCFCSRSPTTTASYSPWVAVLWSQ